MTAPNRALPRHHTYKEFVRVFVHFRPSEIPRFRARDTLRRQAPTRVPPAGVAPSRHWPPSPGATLAGRRLPIPSHGPPGTVWSTCIPCAVIGVGRLDGTLTARENSRTCTKHHRAAERRVHHGGFSERDRPVRSVSAGARSGAVGGAGPGAGHPDRRQAEGQAQTDCVLSLPI